MSRRRTKAEEIRNPEHYFNRYIACERKKSRRKMQSITICIALWMNCRNRQPLALITILPISSL